jgi:hypothetical protein
MNKKQMLLNSDTVPYYSVQKRYNSVSFPKH